MNIEVERSPEAGTQHLLSMTEYGVSINLEPVTQDPSITAIHEVKFQPDLSINDGYTQKECTTDFAKLAVFARQSSKTNPIVADYSVLQRMQLAEMELQLAKYWAQYKARDLNVTWDEMRKMQNLFRNYCKSPCSPSSYVHVHVMT